MHVTAKGKLWLVLLTTWLQNFFNVLERLSWIQKAAHSVGEDVWKYTEQTWEEGAIASYRSNPEAVA